MLRMNLLHSNVRKGWTGTVVHRVNLLPTPILVLVGVQALQSSSLLMHVEKQWNMSQVLGSWSPIWDTEQFSRFLTPNQLNPGCLEPFGEGQMMKDLFLSYCSAFSIT